MAADRPAPTDLGPAALVDLPTRCVVREPSGQTFSLQTGELWFEIDAAGENAYAVVGEHTVVLDGPTLVRGLPHGLVRVFLSAEGRRSAIVEVEVPSQGRGTVRAALPSR